MDNRTHVSFKASDRSYLAIIKKEIHAIAVTTLHSKRLGELDIVVSELVSNLVKHARDGQLLVKTIHHEGIDGIEIISIDHGPGMADVKKMITDGISTKNTLGVGLGAIKRLSDVFQVYSLKEWGTLILVRIFQKPLPSFKKPLPYEIRSIVLPKPGETRSGDGFFTKISSDYVRVFLGDGLGHGEEAAQAVELAGASFEQSQENDPCQIIREMNTSVRKTRGLVGLAAVFNLKTKKWKICGVGNIMTRISGPGFSKNYLSYNGIIGLNMPRTLNPQEIDHEKGQQLILCSDGLKTKWDTFRYPSILRNDLTLLCAALLKDYARNTDDMSVAACKINF